MSINSLAARLEWAGGDRIGRINKQKLRSLQSALKNSYNARQIKTPDKGLWYGLLNEDNLKPDYDRKVISIEHASGLKVGDVFEVLEDHSHWMIYLPHLTETAYLKSDIIRCRYAIEIDGKEYWVYFQGPTETDISWYHKESLAYNKLNLSGTIYIKKDEYTEDFFNRFSKIKLDGHTWEIQVVDRISVPGIIELEVQEYFDNKYEELPYIEKVDTTNQISGNTLVKQNTVQGYMVPNELYNSDYHWVVEGNDRVKIIDELVNGQVCRVQVYPGAIRKYRVKYTDGKSGYHLDVRIDIEEQKIQGDTAVRPFDIKEYRADEKGTFWIEAKSAKVIENKGYSCTVEIVKGKKGKFTLYFKADESGSVYSLPIDILSM